MQGFAIVFVCQRGPLEAKAALLAASLRRLLQFDADLIAAIPGPEDVWGTPAAATIELLARLKIRTVSVANPIDPSYPIANKLQCLSVQTDAKKIILIDSDMLLMRKWTADPRFAVAFNARPASCASFTQNPSDWDKVYAACGVEPLPGVVRTTYSGEYIRPYFNSAFVAVPTGIGFAETWIDCCRKIDATVGIPNKRPYLDQIALSPAIARLKLPYDCLEETYNHPINFKPLTAGRLPLLCHYHDVPTLRREPAAVAMVRALLSDYEDLVPVLQADPAWAPLTRALPIKPRLFGVGGINSIEQGVPEIIITGIPRSGTSYLSNLLHRHDNCVVLNEPPEIGPALEQLQPPWPVALFYRQMRRNIGDGVPIQNKLTHGQVTEDTAQSNEQVTYTPRVQGPDFVLGVKTTIPFLSRLASLREVMPNAPILLCVRNPLDTIASWKTTFAHLREADVRSTRIGNPRDPWLSGISRAELETVANLPDVAVRRAAWWRYLAGLVIDALPMVRLVRYEALVADPEGMLATLLKGFMVGKPTEALAASTARSKASVLDAADVQAIRALCADRAATLGVWEERGG